jgi:hypothetical protein
MEFFVIIENCCNHFAGIAKTEEEAQATVEEYGQGYTYMKWELN